MRTNVYIDGFNLYHRAVQGTPYKWLDLSKLCDFILPNHDISRIRYFTAHVQARPNDPNQPRRQLTYLRALLTIPSLSIHFGLFRTDPKKLPLTDPNPSAPRRFVEVDVTTEKGSDVNLATLLLSDGYHGDYEQAVVISNDSDLALPIQTVRDDLKLPAGVVNPSSSKRSARQLEDASTFQLHIFKKSLRDSQFPTTFTDSQGTITKPSVW
jgi:hypothetical protein